MKTVAFHNNKGGTGKTTLCVHTFYVAVERKLRVILVDTDRQGNAFRWLSHGDGLVEEGALFRFAKDARVLYSPDVLPEGSFHGLDLLLIDTAPQAGVPAKIRPDQWVVPVDGRMAMEGAISTATDILRSDHPVPLNIVVNGVAEAGVITARALREALARVRQDPRHEITVYPTEVPRSASIKRSGELYLPAWDVPYGAKAGGTLALRGLAEFLLKEIERGEADGKEPPKPKHSRKVKRLKAVPVAQDSKHGPRVAVPRSAK